MDPQNPYQSPQSSLTAPEPSGDELADRGIRLVAALIDGVIMLVLLMPVMFLGGYFNQLMQAAQAGEQTFGLQIMWGLIGVIAFFVIQAYPLNQSGQTWGKKVMKIKIVDMDGLQPSLATLLGKRYLFSQGIGLVPCIGAVVQLVDVLMIFRDDRRCLHDQIAGTKVVIAR
ncbi:MAG: RDD family protein [Lysobacter sp.]